MIDIKYSAEVFNFGSCINTLNVNLKGKMSVSCYSFIVLVLSIWFAPLLSGKESRFQNAFYYF